jgi:hypothetical protein
LSVVQPWLTKEPVLRLQLDRKVMFRFPLAMGKQGKKKEKEKVMRFHMKWGKGRPTGWSRDP